MTRNNTSKTSPVKKFSTYNMLLFLVITIGTILRFIEIDNYVRFSGDHGYYFLQAKEMLVNYEFPLVSIPTSVPVFRQGAVFIWVLGLVLKVFNFNPVSAFYFVAILGSISLCVLYMVLKEIFYKRIAILATTFAAFSPLVVMQSRRVSVISPIFLFSVILFWLYYNALNKQSNIFFFLTGFVLSVLFQFELAAFMLFIVFALLFLYIRENIPIKSLIYTLIGGFIGLLPFIIYDYKQGVYIQTLGFFVWALTKPFETLIGYLSGSNTGINYYQGIILFSELIFPSNTPISFGLILASFIFFLYKYRTSILKKSSEFNLIFIWSVISYFSFIVRGIFSGAYMPFLYLPTIVVLAFFFESIFKKTRVIGFFALATIIVLNVKYLLDNNFMAGIKKTTTLQNKIDVATYIKEDSGENEYSLTYVGPGMMYPSSGNNYEYLMWWLGNAPKKQSNITYFVYDENQKINESIPDRAIWIGDIAIDKIIK